VQKATDLLVKTPHLGERTGKKLGNKPAALIAPGAVVVRMSARSGRSRLSRNKRAHADAGSSFLHGQGKITYLDARGQGLESSAGLRARLAAVAREGVARVKQSAGSDLCSLGAAELVICIARKTFPRSK